ncbi:hypothetical protein RvY_04194 [Ramazzottius varieornatus]|uniref:Ig-like domain-containing protein n=1 Tax=Ramazzottius varieornatus TaxID=947166 RepID=A0A1D1UQR7_RAMVA|nr:hypothetical protein RvY_04194 [Ramazzottius varieornatus]
MLNLLCSARPAVPLRSLVPMINMPESFLPVFGLLLTISVLLFPAQGISVLHTRERRELVPTDSPTISHQLYFHEIKPASHMETFLHESVTLTCQAGGSPPPTIHWLKNGQSISQDSFTNTPAERREEEDDATAQVMGNSIGLSSTRSRLFLDCLTPQDSAVYTCVAETPYSRISTDTKLTVSDVPTKAGRADCKEKRSKGYGKPARITMWTDTRMELEGSDVKLFCRASGSPTPKVAWEKVIEGESGEEEIQIVQNDAKHKMLPNGDLLVRKVTFEQDMGRFVCVAQNDMGLDKAKMFLYPTPGL